MTPVNNFFVTLKKLFTNSNQKETFLSAHVQGSTEQETLLRLKILT